MVNQTSLYPLASDPDMVGVYPAHVKSGAGYVYADVLEYRVWCHPERGSPDECEGDDYYHFFTSYEEALIFSQQTLGAEPPLVLVRQTYWIDEKTAGEYLAVKGERLTEWQPHWLSDDAVVKSVEDLKTYYQKEGWVFPDTIVENLYATPLITDFDADAYQQFPRYLGISVCRCVLEQGLTTHHVSHIDGYWYALCYHDRHDLDYADIDDQEEIVLVSMAELLRYQPDLVHLYTLANNSSVDRESRHQPWKTTKWQDDLILPDSPSIH